MPGSAYIGWNGVEDAIQFGGWVEPGGLTPVGLRLLLQDDTLQTSEPGCHSNQNRILLSQIPKTDFQPVQCRISCARASPTDPELSLSWP